MSDAKHVLNPPTQEFLDLPELPDIEGIDFDSAHLQQEASRRHETEHEKEILPSGPSQDEYDMRVAELGQMQQHVAKLQAQLTQLNTQYTRAQTRNDQQLTELAILRSAMNVENRYKQENQELLTNLETEKSKNSTLRVEMARLEGKAQGLRDEEIRKLREEKEVLESARAPKMFIQKEELQNMYKHVLEWVKQDFPNANGQRQQPVARKPSGTAPLAENRPAIPREKSFDGRPRSSATTASTLPPPEQSEGMLQRARSRLSISSLRRTGSSASKRGRSPKSSMRKTDVPAIPPLPASHAPSSKASVPATQGLSDPNGKGKEVAAANEVASTAQQATFVRIPIGSDVEWKNSILTPYLKYDIFNDPGKREHVLDLAMSWQNSFHQSPKCLYIAYMRKPGLWTAKERRDGKPCMNCIEGGHWRTGEVSQCLRLNSRTELDLLNPRPWDREKQEVYNRANAARKAGATKQEIRAIEKEIKTLGVETEEPVADTAVLSRR